jgi:hypothetical protein
MDNSKFATLVLIMSGKRAKASGLRVIVTAAHSKVNAAAVSTIEDLPKPDTSAKAHGLMRRVTRHGFDPSERFSNFGPHYFEHKRACQDENENRFHLARLEI